MTPPKKVVLAYSGGLDTSIILKWLQIEYGCEVVTFTADLGQGEELEPARKKAEILGIAPENIFIEDLREEFVRDFVFPMFRANTVYEGTYLLGTSIARPLIAKRQIEIAKMTGADAVAHGATGKGNDQVRFELCYYALNPHIKIIAPWREWDFQGRQDLIQYAESRQIPIAKDKRGEAPFSVDANLLHASSEGKILEDPWIEAEEFIYSRTIAPEDAPDKPTYIEIGFDKGDKIIDVDGEELDFVLDINRMLLLRPVDKVKVEKSDGSISEINIPDNIGNDIFHNPCHGLVGLRYQNNANGLGPEERGTTHISIVDMEGNILSMTSTIESSFGSKLMSNGYLLNNELTDFSFLAYDKNRSVALTDEGYILVEELLEEAEIIGKSDGLYSLNTKALKKIEIKAIKKFPNINHFIFLFPKCG